MNFANIFELYEDRDISLEIVDRGEWVEDGKYSIKSDVVKFDDRYYQITQARTGSYFSSYDFDEPEIIEVIPRTEMVEVVYWDAV